MTIEPFWDFSVRTYRVDNVAQACLSLQDDCGVDVNMLLFCCWFGRRAGRFDDTLFGAACGFSENWRENVVVKLREARRWMKHTGCQTLPMTADPCGKLREQIKQVELAAEKLQEEALESLLANRPPGNSLGKDIVADTASNLSRYFDHIGQALSDEVRRKLTIIICAAFPGASRETVAATLSAG